MSDPHLDLTTVTSLLEKLPQLDLEDIDTALAWFATHRRRVLEQLNGEVYELACHAIDGLLDARLERMKQ